MSSISTVIALVVIAGAYFAMRWSVRGSRRGDQSIDPPSEHRVLTMFQRFAFQDWLVTGYVLALWTLMAFGSGERRDKALLWVTLDTVAFATLLVVARFPKSPKPLANVAYRLALPGAIISTFTQLHFILPSARSVSFDAQIFALDKAIFGMEPALAWDAYVTPHTTEWFSFFYYLYFGILLVHVLPMSLLERRTNVLREFSWGIFFVFCVGQLVYIAVPGFGPYRLLATEFKHPLEGPTFWPLVAQTVSSFDGAHRTDIFPSLHTAVPTFFTLFSFRHRRLFPFRYTWPVLAFATVNIIVATMFLRWHYLLDVFAGLILATTAFVTASRLPAWEDARRARAGKPPIWLPLFPPPKEEGWVPDGVGLPVFGAAQGSLGTVRSLSEYRGRHTRRDGTAARPSLHDERAP